MINNLRRIILIALAGTLLVLGGWWYAWPKYQWWRARGDAARGDLAAAEKSLTAILRTSPSHTEAVFLHAQVLRKLKRFGEAQAALSRALSEGLPKDDEVHRESALIGAGVNFRNSEASLRKLLHDSPTDLEVMQALAKGCVSQMRWDDAEQAYTDWLQIEPENLDALLGRGQARLRNERWKEAASDFQAMLRQAPEHFHARLLLADCFLSESRLAEAEPELLACRQLRPDRAEPLVGMAICATNQGDLDKAQSLLTEARMLDSSSILVLEELGDHYMLRRRYDLAEESFAKAVRLNPRDREGHLKLSQALLAAGKEELARAHEQRFRELDALPTQRSFR
jgi:tetratricopeptide (TPR) repeat protein